MKAIEAKGHDASFIRADLTSEAQVHALHSQILATYGRLDAAVNNAGISSETYARFADVSTEEMEKLFRVNVFAVFWCMQAQIQAMLAQASGRRDGQDRDEEGVKIKGRIVNISSTLGLHGFASNGVYAGTKHAVMGMTKSAALDYAKDNILITAVAPAVIRTKLVNQAVASGAFSEEEMKAAHPVGRVGEVADVAKAVSFLLGSNFVTGSVVEVDGGYGAQ